jgi:hypothetical protein
MEILSSGLFDLAEAKLDLDFQCDLLLADFLHLLLIYGTNKNLLAHLDKQITRA